MSASVIIGITGAKRSGKTTLAHALERAGFHHDSFAAPVRRMACDVLAPPELSEADRMRWLDEHKEVPIEWLDGALSPRTFMQDLGQTFGRGSQHAGIWIRALSRRIEAAGKRGADVVISDVRNINEAAHIRAMHGVIVQVTRPGVHYTMDAPTEMPLDPWVIDVCVRNDGDIDDLRRKATEQLIAHARRTAHMKRTLHGCQAVAKNTGVL